MSTPDILPGCGFSGRGVPAEEGPRLGLPVEGEPYDRSRKVAPSSLAARAPSLASTQGAPVLLGKVPEPNLMSEVVTGPPMAQGKRLCLRFPAPALSSIPPPHPGLCHAPARGALLVSPFSYHH